MAEQRDTAIAVRGLSKSFGAVTAVSKMDFDVLSGELFGFLGPNGAGKTTTINMLTGLALPNAGSIRVGGVDCTVRPRAAQHLIGVVPDESNLYPELTGFENLSFCAALYGLKKAERTHRARALLAEFDLSDASDRKFGAYSKGMKRKLTIAAGLIHDPDILFLDEPTTGIDVAAARKVRGLIAERHRAGTTIFLTTHYIEEAERLCDRIAFIVAGRVVCIETVENLLQPLHEKHVLQISYDNGRGGLCDALSKAFAQLVFRESEGGRIRVEADRPIGVGPLVRLLEERGAVVTEARRIRPSLEDVFVGITGLEAAAMRREKEKKGGRR